MEQFHNIVNVVGLILSGIGAVITIFGIMISFFDFIKKEIFNRAEALQLNESVRIKLGSYLVLALEFFIASDIVRTVITPTWESLGMLGAIVVIRTVLSYFLTKDLERKA